MWRSSFSVRFGSLSRSVVCSTTNKAPNQATSVPLITRVDVEIENPAQPGEKRRLMSVLVDTGAELSWVPSELLESLGIERYNKRRFRQADGSILERWAGSACVHIAGKRTADDVVFGEPGDVVLLGARTLEGLNLRVEPVSRQLVDAGPAPAAVA
jgi:clan AA aspartic protease